MNQAAPHVRVAEILLVSAVLLLWGYRVLSELLPTGPVPAIPDYRVELNRADWPELTNLPGIGEARAREIVLDRFERGPFHSPEELTRVHGIGPATVDGIKDYLSLE